MGQYKITNDGGIEILSGTLKFDLTASGLAIDSDTYDISFVGSGFGTGRSFLTFSNAKSESGWSLGTNTLLIGKDFAIDANAAVWGSLQASEQIITMVGSQAWNTQGSFQEQQAISGRLTYDYNLGTTNDVIEIWKHGHNGSGGNPYFKFAEPDVWIGTIAQPKATSGGIRPKFTVSMGDSGVSTTGLPIETVAIIENDTTSYMGLLSPDDEVSGVYFGTPTDSFSAILRWDDFNSRLQLGAQVVTSTLEFTVGNKDNPSFTISPQTATLGDRTAELVGYGILSIQEPGSGDNMTYDSSTNVLELTSSTGGGGIIVDTSGDPSPAALSDVYRAAYLITEAPNTQYIPTNMFATAQTFTVALVGPGEQTQGNIGPGIAFTYSDDASTGGSTAMIRLVKSDTDISGETQDGGLLVLGTREADNGGGGALVRESLRIGHNQYLGIMYTPDSSTNPLAMLTLGTNVGDTTTIATRETSATISAITDYGQWYVKSSDGKPYFKDSAGTEYDLTGGGVNPFYVIANSAPLTETVDWNNGESQEVDFELKGAGAVVFTLSNPVNGQSYTLKITQGPNLNTITWPASIKWEGGTPLVPTAVNNAIDVVTMVYDGTNYFASYGTNFN